MINANIHVAYAFRLQCEVCNASMIVTELPWADYTVDTFPPFANELQCSNCKTPHGKWRIWLDPVMRPDTPNSVQIKQMIRDRKKI